MKSAALRSLARISALLLLVLAVCVLVGFVSWTSTGSLDSGVTAALIALFIVGGPGALWLRVYRWYLVLRNRTQ